MKEVLSYYKAQGGFPPESFEHYLQLIPTQQGHQYAAALFNKTASKQGSHETVDLSGDLLTAMLKLAKAENPAVQQRNGNLALISANYVNDSGFVDGSDFRFHVNANNRLVCDAGLAVKFVPYLRILSGTAHAGLSIVDELMEMSSRTNWAVRMVNPAGKNTLSLLVPERGPICKGNDKFDSINEFLESLTTGMLMLKKYTADEKHFAHAAAVRKMMLIEAMKSNRPWDVVDKEVLSRAAGPSSGKFERSQPTVADWDDD